jgi:LysM repeat protein
MQIEDRQKAFLKGLEELSKQTGVTMTVQNQPEQLNSGVVQIRATLALVQVEGWTEPPQAPASDTTEPKK